MRVSELFNTLLFTQQEEEQQEVRVSQLFNTQESLMAVEIASFWNIVKKNVNGY